MLTYSRKNTANRIPKDLGKRDFYRQYKKVAVNRMEYKTFSAVLFDVKYGLFAEIIKMLIFDNFVWKLPDNLGRIAILKSPYKRIVKPDGEIDFSSRLVNWKATKDLWIKDEEKKKNKVLVYLIDKEVFTIRWIYDKKDKIDSRSIIFYAFEPVRTLKWLLNDAIKEHYPHKLDFLPNLK
jgi:hypothetical protein